MAARKGIKRGFKTPGSGRKSGSRNQFTLDVRDTILGAFKAVGGQEYLERVANEQPAIFCTLLGKLLPPEPGAAAGGSARYELVLRWMSPETAQARGLMAPRIMQDAPLRKTGSDPA